MTPSKLRQFLFPDLNLKSLVRIILVALAAFLIFKFILIPFRVQGHSMAPTYADGDFNFCLTLKYRLAPPKRFDVVTVRFSGNRVMLLKRVVAFEGETVAFKDGRLMVDGREIGEPYVSEHRPWNLAPRLVKKDHLYVVGDNRNVPMETHDFGQTPIERIIGGPLW